MEILKADESLNLQDIDDYIQEWNKREQMPWLSIKIRQILKEKSSGNFLYCKSVLSFLQREYGNQDIPSFQVEERIEKLPSELQGLYSEFFRRIKMESLNQDIESLYKFFQCLVGSLSPISINFISQLSGLKKETIQHFCRKYQSFLTKDSQERFAFYHKSFNDWLTTDQYSDFYCNLQQSHQLFAEYGYLLNFWIEIEWFF